MKLSASALADLKRRPENACDAVAGKFVSLRRASKRGWMVGPCPIHSPDRQARDSTSFETNRDSWVCATCADGGDVIALVERTLRIEFRAAVEWLGGAKDLSAEETAKLDAEEQHRREERARMELGKIRRERGRLWDIWQGAFACENSQGERYLKSRGIRIVPSRRRLRFAPMICYYADSKIIAEKNAMLAAIIGPDNKFSGLHFTYLESSEPPTKAEIRDPKSGEILPSKKVRGVKQRGRIELARIQNPKRLVLGEGIETVLSVWQALEKLGRDLTQTAFWSAVDLGNLGGPQDLTEPSIPIPESVEEIILLGDGDSERFLTECALRRAAHRYAREGRVIKIAWAPEGQDFNDILRSAA